MAHPYSGCNDGAEGGRVHCAYTVPHPDQKNKDIIYQLTYFILYIIWKQKDQSCHI